MPTTIKLKNSVTTTNAPSSLVQGEVAINITDKKVWVGNAATTPIQLLGAGGSASFSSIAFGAGTVSLPSITFTGDTNTGIYSPAADTIAFTEGGVESMRIDSSGNVGIGVTPSAWGGSFKIAQVGTLSLVSNSGANSYLGTNWYFNGTNDVYITSNPATQLVQTSGAFIFNRAASGTAGNTFSWSESMRIDSSGNVGIGTSSPRNVAGYSNLVLNGSTSGLLEINTNGTRVFSVYGASNDINLVNPTATGTMQFYTNNAERMRIDSSGNLLVGTTSFTNPYPSAYTAPGIGLGTKTPITWNGTNGAIWGGGGGVDDRLYAAAGNGVIIYSNTNLNVGVQLTGGANSWSSVSDESLKTDLIPIQNATEKVSSLRAVTGRYKTDEETVSRAFLIAQDVQKVLPEAVSEDEETGILNLRYTETIPLLVKAIQEQQAMIEELKAEVALLKSK